MTISPYFRHFQYGRQQRLAEDLIVQSIKHYGIDVKYLPRTIVDQDFLLGEDPLSKFDLAVDIEVYIKSVTGFEGEGDFLSKFNLEIRDQVTFTMARRRWKQITTEKLLTENGYNYQEESATPEWSNSVGILLESGSANGYSITSSRPMEGDLIFLPINNKLYEIRFVEHESIFYQHGKLYTYDITCELFDRDSRLDTGVDIIDNIETQFSMDILYNKVLLEDGESLLTETGDYMILQYRLEDTNRAANNEVIDSEARTVIDFSERSPFLDWS